ncbi:MAG TPA: 3'(2'),5'-bisphosphate nucleotidase CysQ [Steroidobacteraceae bacterium]|nr:3'(2'),5'-bisphosphate nucleotidase CysQ [Steroidobacteraceae bacterium]
MTTDPDRLLLDVTAIAREAGRAILEVYASSFSVQEKADSSPLTEADLRSEKLILAGLKRIAPEIPVLSEETGQVAWATRRNWSRLWVVDPLDGTKEFVQRNGEFTVNIALVDNQRPVLGIVHAPALERDYYACEGVGAFRSDAQASGRPIRAAKRGAGAVRVVGSRSHRGSSLDGFLARVGAHELVEVGSSLKLCLVAEGNADVYPRLGPTCEWDTAAGQCVLEQAGGQVLRLDGEPLAYNREDTLNPSFVGFGDADTDWLALVR